MSPCTKLRVLHVVLTSFLRLVTVLMVLRVLILVLLWNCVLRLEGRFFYSISMMSL